MRWTMKYQKPLCDCGVELRTWKQEAITIQHIITKSGRLVKKEITIRYSEPLNWQRLTCPKCFQEYEWKEDSKGRVVRGVKWEDIEIDRYGVNVR